VTKRHPKREERRRAIEKARKLLAMAEDQAGKPEGENARQKLDKLVAKHHITEAELRPDETPPPRAPAPRPRPAARPPRPKASRRRAHHGRGYTKEYAFYGDFEWIEWQQAQEKAGDELLFRVGVVAMFVNPLTVAMLIWEGQLVFPGVLMVWPLLILGLAAVALWLVTKPVAAWVSSRQGP